MLDRREVRGGATIGQAQARQPIAVSWQLVAPKQASRRKLEAMKMAARIGENTRTITNQGNEAATAPEASVLQLGAPNGAK